MGMAVYCFDIDGTICNQVQGDYRLAVPNSDRIRKINELAHLGHTIKIFTARGSKSGLDWAQETKNQLEEWGLIYHELILGKPHADLYIDDKAIHSENFSWELAPEFGDNPSATK
jgi:hypothetical protein